MHRKSEGELRQEITNVCKLMHGRDLVSAYDGNISVRIGPTRILMTPSGVNKAFMQPSDLVVIDLDGRTLRRDHRPSSEYRMHLTIYAEREDVGCVVHAHPPHCIACTLTGIPMDTVVLPETAFLLGAVATIPYRTPGTDAFAQALVPHLPDRSALLLERHGSVTLGADLWEAYNRLEALEHVARVLFISRGLGELRPLEPAQVADLRAEVVSRGLPWQYAGGAAASGDLIDAISARVLERLGRS